MVIVSPSKVLEEDQTPAVGKHLLMTCHFPPAMENPKSVQKPLERITHWDETEHTLSWVNIDYPKMLFEAERWQVLTALSEEKTLYETREVFAKVLAYAVKMVVKGEEALMRWNGTRER